MAGVLRRRPGTFPATPGGAFWRPRWAIALVTSENSWRPLSVKLKVTFGWSNWSKLGFGSVMSVPESAGRSLITNHSALGSFGLVRRGRAVQPLLLHHERALRDGDHLAVRRLLLAGQLGEEVSLGVGRAGDPGVGLGVEEVVARPGRRALVLEAVRLLLGGELDRVVEAAEGRLAARHVRLRRVRDDVRLPVVEVELGGLPHLLARVRGVAHVGKTDADRVGADPRDLRLGDAEGVGPLADDLDRPVDVRPVDRRVLRRRPGLEDQLGPALEVEAEGRLLGRDDDARSR